MLYIQEAQAMQEKVSAQYKNEIEMAKSQRDFELKKAAYDVEVNTKKAESEMAYQLQVQCSCTFVILVKFWLCLIQYRNILFSCTSLDRWPRQSSALRKRRCRFRWLSGHSRLCCKSRRSAAKRKSWRLKWRSPQKQRNTAWRSWLRHNGERMMLSYIRCSDESWTIEPHKMKLMIISHYCWTICSHKSVQLYDSAQCLFLSWQSAAHHGGWGWGWVH